MSIFSAGGSTKNTMNFLKKMSSSNILAGLESEAQKGVLALSSKTPIESGLTATSWGYEIEYDNDHAAIYWFNTNENDGVNIAVVIQYGHATGSGGYISGIDYINPAMVSVFDQILENVWKRVTTA